MGCGGRLFINQFEGLLLGSFLKCFVHKSLTVIFNPVHNVNVSNNQVLDNLLAVVDSIMVNTTQELPGLAQIQKKSTSRLLEALDNFIERITFIYNSMKKKPFALSDLNKQYPNIAFHINRKVFKSDVFFIARKKAGNAFVEITTDANQSKITSETLAIIKVPQRTFLNKSETLYSYQFRKPSLFLTETQLQRLNRDKVTHNQVVASDVLSAAILRRHIGNLSNPIVLSFKPALTADLQGILDCQFWNSDLGKSTLNSIVLHI